MSRQPRKAFGGQVYHVMNHGKDFREIFKKRGDYLTFMKLMEEGRQRTGMRVLAFCLMPNHWHMVLWPRKDKDLTSFIQWVAGTHVRRWREQRDLVGEGHLYQGRFRNFPVQANENLYRVLGYVEGNARRARKSKRAETWPYGSLYAGKHAAANQVKITPWPVPRPADWVETVNAGIKPEELAVLRLHMYRNRPLGSDAWLRKVVPQMGLESTVREIGRPRNAVAPKVVAKSVKIKAVKPKTVAKHAKAKIAKPKISAKVAKAKVATKAVKPKILAKSIKARIAKK